VEIDRRLNALRRLRYLLDDAFRVPGTSLRFGWDPIVGMVPWLGDALTAVLSCAIVVHAHRLRVPRVVQLRLLGNLAIDMVVGLLPLVGDVADAFWKSNTRNMALLERHAQGGQPATRGDKLFAAALVLAVVAMAIVPLLVVYWIYRSVFT
jgi:Domain of unknown function (DUF4112)